MRRLINVIDVDSTSQQRPVPSGREHNTLYLCRFNVGPLSHHRFNASRSLGVIHGEKDPVLRTLTSDADISIHNRSCKSDGDNGAV